jgi:hypothetical protein
MFRSLLHGRESQLRNILDFTQKLFLGDSYVKELQSETFCEDQFSSQG